MFMFHRQWSFAEACTMRLCRQQSQWDRRDHTILGKRIADIIDGTSQALLLGEKRLNLRELGSPQPDDNEGYTAGWNSDTMCNTNKKTLAGFQWLGDGDERFGSSHFGVFQVTLADGSVQALAYSIDDQVFARLGHVSDGGVVGEY